MAFPQTSIIDALTTNRNPLGGSWAQVATIAQLQVSGNKCVGTAAGTNADYWNGSSFNADQEAYLTVSTKAILTNDGADVFLRLTPASVNGYYIAYTENTTGTDSISIGRIDGGSGTTLATFSQEVAAGHKIGGRIIGTKITAYYDGVAIGSYDTVGDATKYSNAGNIGIIINYTVTSPGLINFGGGNATGDGTMTLNTGFWG